MQKKIKILVKSKLKQTNKKKKKTNSEQIYFYKFFEEISKIFDLEEFLENFQRLGKEFEDILRKLW